MLTRDIDGLTGIGFEVEQLSYGRGVQFPRPDAHGFKACGAREGVHNAEVTEKSVNRVPSAAMRPRRGVRTSFAP
jgi:hypothetical protein